jgi:hypothetical protein
VARVLNGKTDIVLPGEVDGCLNVFDRRGIHYVGWVASFRAATLMLAPQLELERVLITSWKWHASFSRVFLNGGLRVLRVQIER